jgi:ankyrin repeat protein
VRIVYEMLESCTERESDEKLIRAVRNNDPLLFSEGISEGGNVNVMIHAKDKDFAPANPYPLIVYAVSREVHNEEIISKLLSMNVNVNASSGKGLTALLGAAMHSEKLFHRLLTFGANLFALNAAGLNVLMFASRGTQLGVVKYLLEQRNFDLGVLCSEGWSAVNYAAEFGTLEILTYLMEQLHHVATVTLRTGVHPIHSAASRGHLPMLQYLHRHCSTDLNVMNYVKHTPLCRKC